MKKILLTLTALAALVSCSKDEIVESQPAQAIGFSNIFIENSTRAAYDGSYKYNGTTGNLEQFHVYGTVTNANSETANIFYKQLVELKNDAWVYNPIQYWIPGNKYNFTAIADGNIEGATSTTTDNNYNMPASITVTDASKQKDILLAKSKQDIVGLAQGNEKVAFTFDHLMSKAKFTVQNSITTEKYTYMVTDVKITNAAKSATYDLASGWGASTGTYPLAFGDVVTASTESGTVASWANDAIAPKGGSKESNFERLLIPTQAGENTTTAVTVSFDCELFYDGVSISKTNDKTATATVKLEPGHAYNFKIVLSAPGEPIQFTVTKINDWDYDINEDDSVDTKDEVTMQ